VTDVFAACALVALTSVCGCTTTTEAYDYSREPDPRKHEFVLGPADMLHITVWKNPELSTETRVRPDGTVTMPLVGDLRAAGRTPTQVREEIQRRLAAFIRDEGQVVSVAVTEVNSYRFTVNGNVEHPGVYSAKYYVTLAEAIALAGGLNRFAEPEHVAIMRGDANGQVHRIPVNYDLIRSGKQPDANIALLSGDIVIVQ
jgi:polysaccharide export outer membrane protein